MKVSPDMLFFCDLSSWHGLSNVDHSQLCLKQFSFSWILRLQDFVQIRFLSASSQVLRSIFTKVSALFSQNSSLYFPKTFQRNFPPNLNLISSVIHVCEICKLLYCSNAKFSLMAVRGKLLFQHPENREICQDIENYVKVFFNYFFIQQCWQNLWQALRICWTDKVEQLASHSDTMQLVTDNLFLHVVPWN